MTKQKGITQTAIESAAKWLNLTGVPSCIRTARPDVFRGMPFEVVAFLVKVGDMHERNERPESWQPFFREFCKMANLEVGRTYLYKVLNNVFYRKIIGKAKLTPTRIVSLPQSPRPLTSKQEAYCQLVAKGLAPRVAAINAGYGETSAWEMVRRFEGDKRILKRIEEHKQTAE